MRLWYLKVSTFSPYNNTCERYTFCIHVIRSIIELCEVKRFKKKKEREQKIIVSNLTLDNLKKKPLCFYYKLSLINYLRVIV